MWFSNWHVIYHRHYNHYAKGSPSSTRCLLHLICTYITVYICLFYCPVLTLFHAILFYERAFITKYGLFCFYDLYALFYWYWLHFYLMYLSEMTKWRCSIQHHFHRVIAFCFRWREILILEVPGDSVMIITGQGVMPRWPKIELSNVWILSNWPLGSLLVILKYIFKIHAMRWMPQNTFGDKSTLVRQQAIIWVNVDPGVCCHMAS